MNNVSDLMSNININDLDTFFANTDANFSSVFDIKETIVDYSWLNVLEDSLPNIDKIVRNPRRFIVQEEDVEIVEKIKKVSQETIKHLAEHSENIQDLNHVGEVVPKKLLNVHKEDTIDLYENRFIYTLVKRLEGFIDRQLEDLEVISKKEINKKVVYKGKTVLNNRNINIQLNMEEQAVYNFEDDTENLRTRILACYEVIKSFKNTEMIRSIIGCTPVSNPIRKTNLILREPNFQKAYILWVYLDNFEFKDPKTIKCERKEDSSKETRDEFTLSYFVGANAIDEDKDNLMQYKHFDSRLNKLINEYIYDETQDIEEFTKKTRELYNIALTEKQERISAITSIYSNFIRNHNELLKSIE